MQPANRLVDIYLPVSFQVCLMVILRNNAYYFLQITNGKTGVQMNPGFEYRSENHTKVLIILSLILLLCFFSLIIHME
jgi:hypothetical protein